MPLMFRRRFDSTILVLTALFVGCETASPPAPATVSATSGKPTDKDEVRSESSIPAATETSAPVKDVELIEANWNDLQALVAEQKGKIVVVDVWSTSCEPCMKEFPHLVALQKKHPDDLVAISFDVDYIGVKKKPVAFYRERVLKFLSSQAENRILNRMCTTAADEFFTEIKLDSIPAIFVYGSDGALAKLFQGSSGGQEGVSYEKQVIPFVDELLKAQ